jgi:hypothetical protein
MQTLTVTLTDYRYELITQEAARRGVSVDEVVNDWLIEGEERYVPLTVANEAHYANEEHHEAEIEVLGKRHRALANDISPSGVAST